MIPRLFCAPPFVEGDDRCAFESRSAEPDVGRAEARGIGRVVVRLCLAVSFGSHTRFVVFDLAIILDGEAPSLPPSD